jgi:hypothetical protein
MDRAMDAHHLGASQRNQACETSQGKYPYRGTYQAVLSAVVCCLDVTRYLLLQLMHRALAHGLALKSLHLLGLSQCTFYFSVKIWKLSNFPC